MKETDTNGYGKTYWENGSVMYEGIFKNGLEHGQGKVYFEDGTYKMSYQYKQIPVGGVIIEF